VTSSSIKRGRKKKRATIGLTNLAGDAAEESLLEELMMMNDLMNEVD
jgi:hypothetical protein